jgi:hypothetical protein
MNLINLQYKLPSNNVLIEFQYGQTGRGAKGRGSDSDWMVPGSNTVTDYGVFDAYGDQRLIALDIGKVLDQDEQQQLTFLVGWVRQDTANELKNVVYHRFFGVDVGKQSQEDLGSTLDGKFQGIRLGIEKERQWSKWTWVGRVEWSALETKAYGHWANHDPAWNWVDIGYTMGWAVQAGVEYAITANVKAQLGYNMNYVKNYFNLSACEETLTGEGFAEGGEIIPNEVILHDRQQGFYLGLKVGF